MILLFDLSSTQPSQSGKRHGGGKYGEIIFKRIVERGLPVAAFYDSKKWFNPEIMTVIKDYGIDLYDKQNASIENIVNKYGFKRIYFPIIGNICHLDNCEIYGTIHGVRALELQYDPFILKYNTTSFFEKIKFIIKWLSPQFGYRRARNHFSTILKEKKIHFIMVSHHSVNSIRSYFPKETFGKDINCFYSPSTSMKNDLSVKYPEKYYLMVSANRWEKNVLRGIIAFDRLISAGYLKDTKIKITGAQSPSIFNYKIRNLQNFEFMGYVDDIELEQLYHDAYAFVYPSENEGFGYPPLEAMHYSVPSLTSAHTSISEVCEGAVLYFNPFSIEEIMARILYMDDRSVHDRLMISAKKQYEKIKKNQDEDLDRMIDFLYIEK